MTTDHHRLLPPIPYATLADYLADNGGVALLEARSVEPDVLIDVVEGSGLRGRGGAGFPTGLKWRTVAKFESDLLAANVVVNAAEGEPGTVKDRTLLQLNPYAVLEGALIAARAVRANDITIATKASFTDTIRRLHSAIDEIRAAGWLDDPDGTVSIAVVEGPDRYLFGEETAMLEVLDGRQPMPRVAPPYRHGSVEVVTDQVAPASGHDSFEGAADVVMAGTGAGHEAPPTLANNVETLANVPGIIALGPQWFRQIGTADSPGTVLATVTGDVHHPGVYEIPLGLPLEELVALAGGPVRGTRLVGVLGGVSNTFLTDLSTPISYEAMRDAGSGLGSVSFRFVSEEMDPLALAAGVSRFLAVESCGQCTPCKLDGLEIAHALDRLCRNRGTATDVTTVSVRLGTVAEGARCGLGRQHETVVGSILDAFPEAMDQHLRHERAATEPTVIAATAYIDDEGERVDQSIVTAEPAWSGLQTGPANPPAATA